MTQTKKDVTATYTWRLIGRKMSWYSLCTFLFFCLKPTVRKDTWRSTIFVTVMVIFLKVLFWKLPYHSYVQSSVSTVTRRIENSILKGSLQQEILRTWINIRANSLETYQLHKNPSLHFREDCTKTYQLFLYVYFSLNPSRPLYFWKLHWNRN